MCPCNTIKVSGFGTTDTEFVILTTGSTVQLTNGYLYNLIVCQRLPSLSVVLPVFIQVNGVNYPLLDRIGNQVMSDQIKTRANYRMFYGERDPHFLTTNCLCNSQYYGTVPIG